MFEAAWRAWPLSGIPGDSLSSRVRIWIASWRILPAMSSQTVPLPRQHTYLWPIFRASLRLSCDFSVFLFQNRIASNLPMVFLMFSCFPFILWKPCNITWLWNMFGTHYFELWRSWDHQDYFTTIFFNLFHWFLSVLCGEDSNCTAQENIRHFSNRAVSHSRNSQYRPIVIHKGTRMESCQAKHFLRLFLLLMYLLFLSWFWLLLLLLLGFLTPPHRRIYSIFPSS